MFSLQQTLEALDKYGYYGCHQKISIGKELGPFWNLWRAVFSQIHNFLLMANHNLLHFLETLFLENSLFLQLINCGMGGGRECKLMVQFSSGAIPISFNVLPNSSICSIAISRVHCSPQFKFRETVFLYLVFSCKWFAVSLQKNNLPTFCFCKQLFAFAGKAINFLRSFLLAAWWIGSMFKIRPCFFLWYCLSASILV